MSSYDYYADLKQSLFQDQGDPFQSKTGRFAIYNPVARRDMYVTAECYRAIAAMQSTNTGLADPNLYNSSSSFITNWKRVGNSNPDSGRLMGMGTVGKTIFFGVTQTSIPLIPRSIPSSGGRDSGGRGVGGRTIAF